MVRLVEKRKSLIGDNWVNEINPIDFDADYYASIDWYGIDREYITDLLDCSHDAVLNGTSSSDLRPYIKNTASLDTFKEWIGLPDHYIRSGKAIAHKSNREINYDPRFEDPHIELSDSERDDVYAAAGCYLFGDSDAVAQYRRAIELRMAPFNIAVYAANKIILRPSGSLTIEGPPSVLITKKIEIQEGSSINTRSVARILSDKMVKIRQS